MKTHFVILFNYSFDLKDLSGEYMKKRRGRGTGFEKMKGSREGEAMKLNPHGF